ncbi:MAG: type II toxin-antitoxin system RelE/ParE family toxin [bacterium]|nr:type II toxin-antitoxin system RelE/ParE family toxin [bacterium]
MAYRVEISKKAEKELKNIDRNTALRIGIKLMDLVNEPRPRQSVKLKGTDFHRLKVGDYRVIYQIKDSEEIKNILSVGHRREVYRGI